MLARNKWTALHTKIQLGGFNAWVLFTTPAVKSWIVQVSAAMHTQMQARTGLCNWAVDTPALAIIRMKQLTSDLKRALWLTHKHRAAVAIQAFWRDHVLALKARRNAPRVLKNHRSTLWDQHQAVGLHRAMLSQEDSVSTVAADLGWTSPRQPIQTRPTVGQRVWFLAGTGRWSEGVLTRISGDLCDLSTPYGACTGFRLSDVELDPTRCGLFPKGFCRVQLADSQRVVPYQDLQVALDVTEAKADGLDCKKCKEIGFSARECKEAGFNAVQCKAGGFTPAELHPLCDSLSSLKEGAEILTESHFGKLYAKDRDNSSPWKDSTGECWSDSKGTDDVRSTVRALHWSGAEAETDELGDSKVFIV